ncbi:MAG: DUF2752 domain-containing protein, partial [Saccharofermentans sp.]|nr:DUF2752 domain-containing protein [Saccharofermentans sp.]
MNKKALAKTATDAAIAALAGIAYYIFIKVTGLSIPCYIHLTTGLLCPSCGITRMFLLMAQFKFKEAMRCNEFLFFGWPVIVLLVLYVMYKYHAREKLH